MAIPISNSPRMSSLNYLTSYSSKKFLFKGKFDDEVDGFAMGCPLVPVLANLLIGHHEKIWIEQYSGPNALIFRRYVDDIFALFNNENEDVSFLYYLNTRHSNIKFTLEKEADSKLPFLDVFIDSSNPQSLCTSVYRKSTFSTPVLSLLFPNYYL